MAEVRAGAAPMELKGFDSYEISLGDEMRGERASMGKTLEDAERDLRIKARMITAIEECDLSGFPNQSVVAGYVRSYARYLGMDAEDCYQRFCDVSGYQSPAALMSSSGDGSGYGKIPSGPVTANVGAEIAQSRFAAPPPQNRFRARISMGAVTSSLALIALICGLSYGGYALLQDIQRVGFAPLPEAPVVVADAPEIDAPTVDTQRVARPSASDYEGGGILAAQAAPATLPPVESIRRDGPISAIDPNRAGVFAYAEAASLPEMGAIEDKTLTAEAQIAAGDYAVADAAAAEPLMPGIVIHASDDAWIRVRSSDKSVVWQGILKAGEQYVVPDRAEAPDLRTGNAGAVFVFVDGIAYGPVGPRGQIVNSSLVAEDLKASLTEVEPETIAASGLPETLRRADARLVQQ